MKLSRISVSFAFLSMVLAVSAPASAQQNSTKMNGLALSNDKPIQIESDSLEVHEQEKQALFDGAVKVVQGTMTLNAAHMTVFYKGESKAVTSGGGDIDRIAVKGDVSLLSGDQSARGDQGDFDMRTEVLTLTGKQVVLTDGKNVFTGCKLVVQMKSGQARLDNCGKTRVRISLDPKSNTKN